MNESEYWYNKANLDRQYGDYQHEAAMNALVEKQEYNLVSILSPRISKDGSQWCVLYGENLQDGVCGFGNTPYLAVLDFNKAWHQSLTTIEEINKRV